jgi:hypothetical protein
MNKIFKPLMIASACFLAIGTMSLRPVSNQDKNPKTKKTVAPKIQAAILLDVSNSMDGLIEQAKAQLWNMVSTMGKAQCDNNVVPQVELALYEYGRTTNDAKQGYVKQISSFTSDLDQVSKNLFALTTQGGDEYCGHVIFSSLNELNWDNSSNSYKVIFIAGNEDFLQGDVLYTKACTAAKTKGVIVNTIYCGDRMQGIREHWNLSAECGDGSFTNINQDVKIEEIPTPYDSILFTLNGDLNNTYMAYGSGGYAKMAMQTEVDQMNFKANRSAAAKRVGVKSKSNLYKNDSWDMVDGFDLGNGEEFLKKLDKKTLPDSLKNKSTAELKVVIEQKKQERGAVQKKIESINKQREDYIANERKKNAASPKEATLESEVEKIIKVQALRYKMKID